jgi:hypothetical protein
MEYRAFENEIEVYVTPDGYGRAAIVRRADGLFCKYRDWKWRERTGRALGSEGPYVESWFEEETPLAVLYGDPDRDETASSPSLEYSERLTMHGVKFAGTADFQTPSCFRERRQSNRPDVGFPCPLHHCTHCQNPFGGNLLRRTYTCCPIFSIRCRRLQARADVETRLPRVRRRFTGP